MSRQNLISDSAIDKLAKDIPLPCWCIDKGIDSLQRCIPQPIKYSGRLLRFTIRIDGGNLSFILEDEFTRLIREAQQEIE